MIKLPDLGSNEDLFYFLLHLIHERFPEHAILKGGMVLRLLGSKRETLDLDYVFVPFNSKNQILKEIENLFAEIEDLNYKVTVNSKAIRVILSHNNLRAQVEINVAETIKSTVISTGRLQSATNTTASRIIKIMDFSVALSHKIAAWNERRLLRDLYDIYYFVGVQNIMPDMDVLSVRLSKFESRLPRLKKLKTVDIDYLLNELEASVISLDQNTINLELADLLDSSETIGLHYKIKDAISKLINYLTSIS